MVPDLVIAGIPVIAIIVGLIDFAKGLGLPTKYAQLLAIVLGVGVGLLVQTMEAYPAIGPWVTHAVIGMVVGMAATGLYRVGSRWVEK